MTRYKPSIHRGYCSTTHGHSDVDGEGKDGLHEERPQRMGVKRPQRVSPSDGLAFYRTRHVIPPSTKVPYATGRSLRRVKGSLRSPGVVQNPHALARRGRQNHVQSLSNNTKGSCKGIIQQVNTQLH